MDKKRVIQEKVEKLLGMFPIVAVVGSRQCGKSTFVNHLRPQWKYYDLESPDDYQLISSDPVAFFSINHGDVIIDEAQQYPEIFKTLRGVVDADRKRKGRFVITGSSSPTIVKEITESLAGRIATVELWPFKQCEYQETGLSEFYSLICDRSAVPDDLLQLRPLTSLGQSMAVWFKGGFPEPLIEGEANDEFHRLWMENYIANYVGRDIRGLFPRLNIHNFRRFLTLLAQFSGHQLNMSTMARALEIGVSTVRDYLDIIHQTFLWRNLEAFTKNPVKKVQKSKKGFFRDQGLLHYFLKIADPDQLLLHPVAGFSFESFVTEEIIRGFQATTATQMEFTYYRTIDKSEIDLVIEGSFGIVPVEIKLNASVSRNALRGLENFIRDLNAEYGILINRAKRAERLTDRIIQIPVNYI
jgi:predicted AAA+ superfamily ATPase